MSHAFDLAVLKSIPLTEVLAAQGFTPRDPGHVQWTRGGRIIEVSGQSYMEPATQAIGKGAIDLTTRLTGFDLPEVLPWLADLLRGVHAELPSRATTDIRPKSLRLPPRHDHLLPQMHKDLCKGMGISDSLIRALIKVGRLYADERGRAVCLMRNMEGLAVGAEIITVSPDGSANCQFAFGTRRSDGTFYINGTSPHARIVIVESALEALAYVSLKPNDNAISIGGIFNHDLLDLIGNALVDRSAPVFAGHGTSPESLMGAVHLDPRFGWAHLSPAAFSPTATRWIELLKGQVQARREPDVEEELL